MEDLTILTGNAHPEFAETICRYLGVPLGVMDPHTFSNGERLPQVLNNIRKNDVFIVQSLCKSVDGSIVVDNAIIELLLMMDACRRAVVKSITVIVPYYAYGRSDKKDQPRIPISARALADWITITGGSHVLTMD